MEPVELIRNVQIHIHSIPNLINFTVIRNKEKNEAYTIFFSCLKYIDGQVNFDGGNKIVTIWRNDTINDTCARGSDQSY